MKASLRVRRSTGDFLFDTFNIVFMVLFCITILFPIWDMIVVSFSPATAVSSLSFNFWPQDFTLDSYKYCLSNDKVFNAFVVSVFRTFTGTLIHLVVVAFAAYPLSKQNIPFKKTFLLFFLIPMFFRGGLIPTFLLIKNIGLIDSLLVYVLPMAFSPFVMIILRNFFLSIDRSMEESAYMDGAGVFTILFRIILPLSKPVLATLTLWHVVLQWNSWFDSLIYIRDESKIVMQLLLRRMLDETEMMAEDMKVFAMTQPGGVVFNSNTVKAAITVIVVAPIVTVYPFLQKYFVKGIMLGAVKG